MTDIILPAGRSAMELALFVLLPVMVVMLSVMRLLEAKGLLDWVVARLAPLVKPFGLSGLGVFAALQISFVGFAAPIATMAMMEQRGASDRHLAAVLALVFAMAQANASLPLGALGLDVGLVLGFSVIGGLTAAGAAYHLFGRGLSCAAVVSDDRLSHQGAEGAKGVLDVINRSGAEAFRITIGAIPLLVLALVVVTALRQTGVVDGLTRISAPVLGQLGIDPVLVLPTFTKYLGGATAMMAVMDELLRHGLITVELLNKAAGFLVHPFDLPGVAILISAGPRVAAVWKPAAAGAGLGIAVRTLGHVLFG